MARKKLTYDINFNTDMSSLELLQEALTNLETRARNFRVKVGGTVETKTELQQIQTTIEQVEKALTSCYNPKINTLNFEQFNNILAATGLNAQVIEERFKKLGSDGTRAFRQLAEQVYTSNASLKQTKSFLSEIGDTLMNAAKWSVAYGVINNITNGIKSAWTYATSLDSALNDIRIVTGKSYENMEKFAKSANKAAKALGTSTMDYTKGSLIYYQQGLSEKEVAARTEVTAKAANVTGQTMSEVSEQLTAVWNGFNVAASETESYVDRLAAVAASTASDLEELSTAMSRVASSANAMGIDIDQLTAQIATIESVTRQDAASIGTSLKTIYARMGDLTLGEEDEFGVALGDVSGQLKQMGIDILDQSGNMRDLGTVIEEVAGKWDTWTRAQQQAAAVALAGKRQYNTLFALFENWDMYESSKSVSENSLGELQKEQDTYMESTKAHLEQLSVSVEKFKDAFFDNKGINTFIDLLTTLMDVFGEFTESIGGGASLLLGVFGLLGNQMSAVIGKNIGGGLHDFLSVKRKTDQNTREANAEKTVRSQFADSSDEVVQKMAAIEAKKAEYAEYLDEADEKRYNILIQQTNELESQLEKLRQLQEKVKEITKAAASEGTTGESIFTGTEIGVPSDGLSIDELGALSDEQKLALAGNIQDHLGILAEKAKRTAEIVKADNSYFSTLDITNKETADSVRPREKYTEKIGGLHEAVIAAWDGKFTSEETKRELEMASDYLLGVTDAEGKIDVSSKDSRKAIQAATKALTHAYTEEKVALNAVNEAMNTNATDMEAAKEGAANVRAEVDELNNEQKWKQVTDKFSTVTSAAMGAFSAILSLTNAFKTLWDDSADGWDKAKAILSGLLASFIALIPAAKLLAEVVQDIRAKRAAAAAAEIKEEGATTGAVVAGERVKGAAMKKTGDTAEKAGRKATAAWGIYALILIAIIAAIAIVVALVSSIKSPLEQATKKFEEASAALEEFETNLQNCKSAYEELQDTFSKYHDSLSAIDKLKAGTEEWSDAIAEANRQVLELISVYPELANDKYLSQDDRGLLVISEEGEQLVKNKSKSAITKAQSNVYAQQIVVNEEKNNVNKEQWLESNADKASSFGSVAAYVGAIESTAAAGAGAGAGVGALVGSVLPGIGTAIGAAVGTVVGTVAGVVTGFVAEFGEQAKTAVESKSLESIYGEATEGYATQGAKYWESTEFNNMINQLGLNTDEMAELKQSLIDTITTVDANTKANKQLSLQTAKSFLSGNSVYESSSDKQLYAALVAEAASGLEDKYEKDINIKQFRNDDNTRKDFAAAMGIDVTDILSAEDDVIKYIDASGDTKEISKTAAVNAMNQYNKLSSAAEDSERINKIVSGMTGSDDLKNFTGLVQGVKSISLENLTADDLSKLNTDTVKAEMNKLNLSPEDFKKYFGYDSIDDWVAAAKRSITLTQNEFETVKGRMLASGLGESTFEALNKGMTVQQSKQLAAGAEKAYMQGGAGGSQALANMLTKIENTSERAAAAQVAANIDWTSVIASASFVAQMKSLGYDIDLTSDAYKNFIGTLNKSADVVKASADNFNSVLDALSQIEELTDDLDIGGLVSEEDYKAMLAMNAAVEDYFVLTSNGYKMIKGSGAELNSLLKQNFQSLDEVATHYQNLKEIQSTLENQQSVNTGADAPDLYAAISGLSLNNDQMQIVLKQAGISQDQWNAIKNKKGAGLSDSQKTALKTIGTAINTIKGGDWTNEKASEVYGTSIVRSLDELEQARKRETISQEAYEKSRLSWLATYAEEYGYTAEILDELQKKEHLSGKGLEKTLATLNNYKDVLAAMENSTSNLTGEERAAALKKQQSFLTEITEAQRNSVEAAARVVGYNSKQLDYTSLMLKYSEIQSSLDETKKENWKTLLALAKELEEIQSSITDKAIEEANARIDAVKNAAELRQAQRRFNAEYKDRTGFELQDELTLSQRLSLSKADTEDNLQLIKQYQEELKKAKQTLEDDTLDDNERAKIEQHRINLEKSLIDAYESEAENIKELYQIWLDGWDNVIEKVDDYSDKLEYLNKIYDKQISLTKLLSKTIDDESLKNILAAQENNLNNIVTARAAAYAEALERYESLGESASEAERENAEQYLQNAADAYIAAVENYGEKLKANFVTTVENIYEVLGISDASEVWNRTKTANERYLNPADAQLNINQIRRQYQTAIDQASSLNAQTQLRIKMEQELIKLQEKKDKLSQYEVDRANAVYELTLKQIALEESQRNASKMRLVRDSNGNLTYAFTQDSDAALSAQAELEEAQNKLFNVDNNSLNSLIDQYYQLQEEAKGAISGAGDAAAAASLQDYYYGNNGLITGVQKQIQEILPNLQSSFETIFPGGSASSLAAYIQGQEISNKDLLEQADSLTTVISEFGEKWESFSGDDGSLQALLNTIGGESSGLIKTISDMSPSINSLTSEITGLVDELSEMRNLLAAKWGADTEEKSASKQDNLLSSAVNSVLNGGLVSRLSKDVSTQDQESPEDQIWAKWKDYSSGLTSDEIRINEPPSNWIIAPPSGNITAPTGYSDSSVRNTNSSISFGNIYVTASTEELGSKTADEIISGLNTIKGINKR